MLRRVQLHSALRGSGVAPDIWATSPTQLVLIEAMAPDEAIASVPSEYLDETEKLMALTSVWVRAGAECRESNDGAPGGLSVRPLP